MGPSNSYIATRDRKRFKLISGALSIASLTFERRLMPPVCAFIVLAALQFGVFLDVAVAQPSPPDIGNEYVTNITMNRPQRSGLLYASGDYTLFVQSTPSDPFPNQLNLGNQGQQETYVTYNPANKTCNAGVDPLFCRNGATCNKSACICLWDNPFMGLPYTTLKGQCEPSGADKWVVTNGGYVLTYCITKGLRPQPLSLLITGAGGTLSYNFTSFKEQRVPPSTFSFPSYCSCPAGSSKPTDSEV